MEYGIYDILKLLGALGLFLYGMKVMSDSLLQVAGDKMRKILASMTSNRVFAVLTGFLITAVIQSSSATTLMVVSFVNAALLTLTEAIGVILGAHIGTTITAWIITILGFKVSISAIALPLVGLGVIFTFLKKENLKTWGHFIIGFAILFIGLQFLKDSVPDIKQNPEMLAFLKSFTNMGVWSYLIFLLIGTLLTVIIQSSSATMALTLIMCNEGWLPFDMAAAMVLGENIGTTITANLGAIMANYQAKRAARAHFISNTLGVLWAMILLVPFLGLINWFVTRNGGLSPFDSPTAIPVALSLFHTSFNIANTLILIGLVPIIARIVIKMVPAKEEEEFGVEMPMYLSEDALSYPETALSSIYKETQRLFEGTTFEVVAHGMNLHREDITSDMKIKELVKSSTEPLDVDIDELYYTKVKSIYSKIIEYATLAQAKLKLTKDQTKTIANLKLAARDIVEVIKNTRGMQKNVDTYMLSDNKYIKKAYNDLRRKITAILREIFETKEDKKPEKHIKTLEKLKSKARKADVMKDGTLDKLIRKELITSEMATSLANDSENVADISRNLIDVAELLYIQNDTLLDELEEENGD